MISLSIFFYDMHMKGLSTEFLHLKSIKDLIKEFSIEPKKAMGQNFLTNSFITDNMVLSAGNLFGQTVVEVGPGPGILTRSILSTEAKRVIAIEMDKRCIAALSELQELAGNRLHVMNQDALRINWSDILDDKFCVIANLPYNIATQLMQIWFESNKITQVIVMIQKEVAERFSASHGESGYSRLSVLTQSRWDAQILFDVSAAEFYPPPKVTSSVIRFIPKESRLSDVSYKSLDKLLKVSFSQRRKVLRSSLKSIVHDPINILESVGLDLNVRAEDVSIGQYILMADMLL